jgi:uncharacterized damage-inducible protein DinB
MTIDAGVSLSDHVHQADAALARLQGVVERLSDGDLHLAHRDGGWTVAQCISHINVCNIMWLGDLQRLAADPELRFFHREEIGHDLTGYPPPTVERAVSQLASTRRSLTTAVPATDEALLGRTVEIPDLGTMTVAEWTPIITGHLAHHVEQALDVLRDRDAMPEGA